MPTEAYASRCRIGLATAGAWWAAGAALIGPSCSIIEIVIDRGILQINGAIKLAGRCALLLD